MGKLPDIPDFRIIKIQNPPDRITLVKWILMAAALIAIIIGAYQCGSSGKEQSMRQILKAHQRTQDSLREQNSRQEAKIAAQDALIQTSDAEIASLRDRISLSEENRRRDSAESIQRLKSLRDRLNASTDDEIAQEMDSSFRNQVLGGDFLVPLEGLVPISRPVATWHILKREEAGRLIREVSILKDELKDWRLIGLEYESQKDAWKIKEDSWNNILKNKDAEIASGEIALDGMTGKARKFRRQRNGVIILSTVIIGGITYAIIR